ncbi:MAG: hypothetical protein MMC33_004125 [Icmadophila ericetorum]|nr:hypothetical protein [Icmadophila ericetorum]
MAYSPSPQSTPLIASENVLHFGRHSATPPPSQPISKRDKRRNATMERLNDINLTFTMNREAHSRAQLNSLTRDMNYISRVDLYQPKLLDDTADEIYGATEATIAETSRLGLRSGTINGSLVDGEARAGTGKWAAIFTQQVNDAMEERDAQLTALANRHQDTVDSLCEDNRWAIKVAKEEHKILEKSVRDRVMQQVQKKKNQMLREKEHLDITDTNALLLHPSQFSITHPVSPNNGQSNRKTRHTRHRLDVDDMGKGNDSNKRKRKIPADFDNGSPGPSIRAIDSEGVAWEKSQAATDYQQQAIHVMSIDRLFTAKDLSATTQAAYENTAQIWNAKALNGNGNNVNGLGLANGSFADADGSLPSCGNALNLDGADNDLEDAMFLGTPDMDRLGSQAMHVTRSTRNNLSNNPVTPLSMADIRVNGRQAAYVAIAASTKQARSKENESLALGLSEQEAIDDLLKMGIDPDPENNK